MSKFKFSALSMALVLFAAATPDAFAARRAPGTTTPPPVAAPSATKPVISPL